MKRRGRRPGAPLRDSGAPGPGKESRSGHKPSHRGYHGAVGARSMMERDAMPRRPSRVARARRGPRIALGVTLCVVSAVAIAARQQSSAAVTTIDVETVGPKVGDALPGFSLRDQSGQVRSLKSLLGPNGAVIVFFRSADW